jgi:hydroxymethylbilane synthase
MKQQIRIGTRGSSLALAQTNEVIQSLKKVAPSVRCEAVKIRTQGDKIREVGVTATEGKSVFTKEIDDALIGGHVDLAVHSMKDLTTDIPGGLTIAAVPERLNPRDVLISRDNRKLQQLPANARIGTRSARRRTQLLSARSDLVVVNANGNIDTRLRKLERGDFDAIVLAAAGLIRLGLENTATEFLSAEQMLPAVGQGALALECREDDDELRCLTAKLDHKESRRAIEGERAFAKRLGADCRTPIAAYARVNNEMLAIDGMVASTNGKMLLRSQIESDDPVASNVGTRLAELLLEKGAQLVLEAT